MLPLAHLKSCKSDKKDMALKYPIYKGQIAKQEVPLNKMALFGAVNLRFSQTRFGIQNIEHQIYDTRK